MQHYNEKLEPALKNAGIDLVDVPRFRKMVTGTRMKKMKVHYTSQKNEHNQKYMVRNLVFEPNISTDGNKYIDECINNTSHLFSHKLPVIISNHRCAFVGGISKKNRNRSLIILNKFLACICNKWPDIEFLSVDNLIRNDV